MTDFTNFSLVRLVGGRSIAVTILLSGCELLDNKEKDEEIFRLQTELALQKGTRAAELEFYERQASFYLGCLAFFNRCSAETETLGKSLLNNGYSGKTSGWYWLGLFGRFFFFVISVSIGIILFRHLRLVIICPKEEAVSRARKLVDEVDNYILMGTQWKKDHAHKVDAQKIEFASILAKIKLRTKELDDLNQSLLEGYGELETLQYTIRETNSRCNSRLDEL
ncbi:hypothetical protein [Hydrogenophaga sp.]|uniref:hypothetical protein n=1 Tax=Hydrogenophaga sp. TaxID=1904254 RepID=UPI002724D056|nr:hypothetical protein [Hydrogenophaga sp.]MDO9504060.1 hypothetical protein [Hydrogenophaga sp.]